MRWLLRLFGLRGIYISRTRDLPHWPGPPIVSDKKMRERDIARLREAGEEAIHRFQPDKDEQGNERTWCNLGCAHIARAMGYSGFMGLLANQIVGKMKKDPDFAEVAPEIAQKLANDGKLVIAGLQDEPHGHVAVLMPGTALFSPKWKAMAPVVANVGPADRQKIWGANHSFGKQPKYWAFVA